MASSALLKSHISDEGLSMHENSAMSTSPFISMFKKDHTLHQSVTKQYLKHWEKGEGDLGDIDVDEGRASREHHYASLVNSYYDLVTDLFESGWAKSFHFCRFNPGEPFLQAMARHEHYLASVLHLQPGMTILDVGCGVGGPAREIATFTGCEVIGLNNNAYQVERARKHTKEAGLEGAVQFVKGDFMKIPFPDNTFDAIYAIEATLHAPSLAAVYAEIHRVLKPRGTFAVYEWVLTPAFQLSNPVHRKIRLQIEHGDGIPRLVTQTEAEVAMRTAGFNLTRSDDLANVGDVVPWWYPLAGQWRFVRSFWDALTMLRVARSGRMGMMGLLKGLELLGVCPGGTAAAAGCLEVAARSLVEGGESGIFSPMFLMVGKKET